MSSSDSYQVFTVKEPVSRSYLITPPDNHIAAPVLPGSNPEHRSASADIRKNLADVRANSTYISKKHTDTGGKFTEVRPIITYLSENLTEVRKSSADIRKNRVDAREIYTDMSRYHTDTGKNLADIRSAFTELSMADAEHLLFIH